jgi:hypothetical protein
MTDITDLPFSPLVDDAMKTLAEAAVHLTARLINDGLDPTTAVRGTRAVMDSIISEIAATPDAVLAVVAQA